MVGTITTAFSPRMAFQTDMGRRSPPPKLSSDLYCKNEWGGAQFGIRGKVGIFFWCVYLLLVHLPRFLHECYCSENRFGKIRLAQLRMRHFAGPFVRSQPLGGFLRFSECRNFIATTKVGRKRLARFQRHHFAGPLSVANFQCGTFFCFHNAGIILHQRGWVGNGKSQLVQFRRSSSSGFLVRGQLPLQDLMWFP